MKIVPPMPKRKYLEVEVSDFKGMNDTLHPNLLKENVLTNCLNSYSKNGTLTKRNGVTIDGDTLTSKHTEAFTATTKRDASATTGQWTTDGTANLFINSTAQIDTSTNLYPTGNQKDRHVVISSNGTIVITYNDGGGIKARKSTDNGTTWVNLAGEAGETTIYSRSYNYYSDWSICIDSSDNIHITYTNVSIDVVYKKLTYDSGNWTVGDENAVFTAGNSYHSSVIVDSSDNIYCAFFGSFSETSEPTNLYVMTSDDAGDTWSLSHQINYNTASPEPIWPCLVLNNDLPLLVYSYGNTTGKLYFVTYDGEDWTSVTNLSLGQGSSASFSVSVLSTNNIWVLYKTNSGIKVSKFNGTAISDTTDISLASNDQYPTLSTDGTNLWAIWSKYEAAYRYELTYKLYDGSSWDLVANDLTSDNGNNIYPSAPETISTYAKFPIIWRTQTSSPYKLAGRVSQLSGTIQSIGYDSTAGSQTYSATVTSTANGGTITTTYADSADDETYSSFGAIGDMSDQYIKFKSVLTTNKLHISPTISTVEITFGGVSIISGFSWTRNDGEHYRIAIGSTNMYLKMSDDSWMTIKANLTTGLRATATPFQNFLIITNGTDPVMRFNGKITTGTVTTVNGDATVTGSGTTWNTASASDQLIAGARIKLADGTWYTVDTVTDDTHIELTVNYAGEGGAGESYEAYSVVALAGSPNTGKYCITHKNYVFIAGNSTNPTYLYFSDIDDATTWPSANFIDIHTNDGQIITGLASNSDVLGVFKYDTKGTRKSVVGLFGSVSSEFYTKTLNTNFSAVNHYSIISAPNSVLFLDREGWVETNFVNFNRIDSSRMETSLGTINQQYIQNSVGAYLDNQAILSFPTGSSTINDTTLIYDLEDKTFTKHSGFNPGCYFLSTESYTPELYFGDQTANSSVFTWDSGTSDNGQAIDWTIESAEIPIKKYFFKKRLKYLYAFFESTGDYDVTASYALNGADTYTDLSEAVSTTATDNADVFKRWSLPGLTGSTIRFKFRNNAADEPITMVKFALVAIEKGLRRI